MHKDAETLEETAKQKGSRPSKRRKPLVVDDTGVFFLAFQNFPGHRPKRVFEGLGFDGLLKKLEGAAVATDAFAPFEDSPEAAYNAGVRAMLFIEGGDRFSAIVERMKAHGDVSYIALPPEERHFSHH